MRYEDYVEALAPTYVDRDRLMELQPFFEEAMVAAEITTANRAAAWFSQVGHESSGLRYMAEIERSNPTWSWDRTRYRGRGPIQLTWESNYRKFGEWCRHKGLVVDSELFVKQPELVEQPKWGFLAASWYWLNAGPFAGRINEFADRGDILNVSRAVNGNVPTPNGMPDRTARWNNARRLGDAILPSTAERKPAVENVLNYDRAVVPQETPYWCGPASCQVVLNNRGIIRSEQNLAVELGTHTGGTDHIGQVQRTLNKALPDAKYVVVEMPNDPPSAEQREALWTNLRRSVNAGFGAVCNIVAPASNPPIAVPPSTISPAYAGFPVYHYFTVMGWREDGGARSLWIADSGFRPFGYWISLEQLATLIPPKGYTYATGGVPVEPDQEGFLMALTAQQQERLYFELTNEFTSLFVDADGNPSQFKGTLGRYIQLTDAKVEAMRLRQIEQDRKVDETLRLVQAMAAKAGVK